MYFYTDELINNLTANITDSDIGDLILGWVYAIQTKINLSFSNSTFDDFDTCFKVIEG